METNKGLKWVILHTVDDNKVILIRLIVGLVFLSEGIQKFLFPESLGTGRFLQIGFSNPGFWAYFTGTFEIICAVFILTGLLVRLAAFPLIIIMFTAFITTKWPILLNKGFWAMAHEYRTDFAMTVLLFYLLISGAGNWSFDLTLNKISRINKEFLVVGILTIILFTGCHNSSAISEKTATSAIPVTVTALRRGPVSNYLELSATSAFLFKASVKAPVTGYIENMFISQGDAVVNNKQLFTIKTKEASAIVSDSTNTLNFKGNVDVRAAVSGMVSSIDHPKGDYVAEGEQLCQIAIPESFVFILDIPFELSGSLKINSACEIILPDGKSIQGVIKSRFPSMNGTSQTERFIIKLSEPVNLPENLIAKIRIIKESAGKAESLPKSAILTDETMQNFWVMKLINDSTAIKVPVITGISENEYVQIKSPSFIDTDLFLSSGNFGLGDTATVRVIKPLSNGQ